MRHTILILAAFVGLSWGAEAAEPSAAALKASANKAWRARDYDKACAAWRQALALAPIDAPTWADLGLCEYKRGKTTESVGASRRAVALGDLAVRKAAYFNLALAGEDELGRPEKDTWVEGQPVHCEEIAAGECGLKVRSCVLAETGLGRKGGGFRTWSRLEVCAAQGCGNQSRPTAAPPGSAPASRDRPRSRSPSPS